MIQVNGLWLPDQVPGYKPTVLPKAITIDGRFMPGMYDATVAYCRMKRVAVDCGAHVGTWTRMMANDFAFVYAFEPWPAHIECFERNLAGRANIQLNRCAVGSYNGEVRLETADRTPVRVGHEGIEVAQIKLDDLDLLDVDLLKTNLEGYDLAALHGAETLLRRWHPVVMVEQHHIWRPSDYGYRDLEALDFLRDLGAGLRFQWKNPGKKHLSPHYCLSWND